MYFTACTTPEELLSTYRKLAMQHHPDHGGNLRTMQEINAEYAEACGRMARKGAYERQAEAHAAGRKSAADYHDIDGVAEEIRRMILAALEISPDLVVELCGLWVWVSGDTRAHKDAIKAAGFKFAAQKAAWYYAGVPSMSRGGFTMDDIRGMHGSTRFTRKPKAEEEDTTQERRAEALHA